MAAGQKASRPNPFFTPDIIRQRQKVERQDSVFLKHLRSLLARFEETRIGFGLSIVWSMFWLILIAAPAAVILKVTKNRRSLAYLTTLAVELLLAGTLWLVGFYPETLAWIVLIWYLLLLAETRSEINKMQSQHHPSLKMGFDYP